MRGTRQWRAVWLGQWGCTPQTPLCGASSRPVSALWLSHSTLSLADQRAVSYDSVEVEGAEENSGVLFSSHLGSGGCHREQFENKGRKEEDSGLSCGNTA